MRRVQPRVLLGVTGSSGFVGGALCRAAMARGWQIRRLSRALQPGELDDLDALVHLAGEPIDGRWTADKKRAIAGSRIDGTRRLVRALSQSARPPRTLVAASAVGYYGDRDLRPLTEDEPAGLGFLAGVCRDWERESFGARALGIRTAVLRTGIVLGDGGALKRLTPPFRYGVGGPLGSGRQFVPWIHIDDLVSMYLEAAARDWSGAFNAVTPDYATSARLAQAIGAALARPAFAYAPSLALRLLLGEFASTLLGSQVVIPARAQSAGFAWEHGRLESAVQSILAPQRPATLVRFLRREQLVAAPIDEVFAYFARASNLEAITPPSLRFALRSPIVHMHAGTRIAYRLRLHGIPFGWQTLIARWDPPNGFVDVQLRGPYALWEHRHAFEPRGPYTLVRDAVDYALPLHPLSELAQRFVRRDVEAIFDYRSRIIAQRFGAG